MDLRTTKHFETRCKERLGINKKSALKYFTKAFYHGIRSYEFRSNKPFKEYLSKVICSTEDADVEYLCYYHHIIVYKARIDGKGYIAITVLNIPQRYLKAVDREFDKRRRQTWKNKM